MLVRTGIAAVALMTGMAAASQHAVAVSEPAHASADSFKAVNYDTMLLSNLMQVVTGTNSVNTARVKEMLSQDFLRDEDVDVIVLEGLFHIDSSKQLLNGLLDLGYIYQTRVVGASEWGGTYAQDWDAEHWHSTGTEPENGGVAIVSRYPIQVAEQTVFQDGCGSDKHAAKGFAYTKINKNGRQFSIIGTHPQSTDSGCGSSKGAADIRAKQFREIDEFLTYKEKKNQISQDEPVLLLGDMNVDRSTAEYENMLRLLQAGDGSRSGERYSFDTHNNDIARLRYPTDAAEDLDFALQRTSHTRLTGWASQVVRPRGSQPIRLTAGGRQTDTTDLSDHYALTASGAFPQDRP
ncbi:endonuclease/exonuclease/phosphatase family protein [Streptomyces sp. NPDC007971]|uniref:endonuclease/exonuclease/phosphatase family protein n=1 Tax=Streptomyces sp. NPDC007971 TaxID=3364799 RepID=UPI0036EC45CC